MKILQKNARETTSDPREISKSNCLRLLFFQGEKIFSRQIVFPRVCFSLALILNTENIKKTCVKHLLILVTRETKTLGWTTSPPVSVKQNMSKCYFAQNPDIGKEPISQEPGAHQLMPTLVLSPTSAAYPMGTRPLAGSSLSSFRYRFILP